MAFARYGLAGYNLGSAALWFDILWRSTVVLLSGSHQVWGEVEATLTIVQAGAVLEVAFAACRLIRSPVATTAVQVFARCCLLFGCLKYSPTATAHWGCALMVTTWACADIPRYLFYFCKQFGAVPTPVESLRFNLFLGLYPLGVCAEIVCLWVAATDVHRNGPRLLLPHNHEISLYAVLYTCAATMYLPCFPMLYRHMLAQRAKMYKARLGKTQSAVE
jgi:very-long-chain (3R)-3-hydroxyacyl-CoA dehydratase